MGARPEATTRMPPSVRAIGRCQRCLKQDDRNGQQQGCDIIDQAIGEQRGDQFRPTRAGQGGQHHGLKYADAAWDMGDEDGDDRQRIADEEGGPLVKADAGDQDEQRGAGRGNIHRADADLRQDAGGWRDRDAPAAQPDRASAPSRPDGKAGDRQQQRDAQPPQQVRRPGERADRHHLRTPDQHRACQHEHPAPEGRAGDRHHARNVAERQARRGIDAVAGRSARQQRQAKIMAERKLVKDASAAVR